MLASRRPGALNGAARTVQFLARLNTSRTFKSAYSAAVSVYQQTYGMNMTALDDKMAAQDTEE